LHKGNRLTNKLADIRQLICYAMIGIVSNLVGYVI
jgi:hypothetical protein